MSEAIRGRSPWIARRPCPITPPPPTRGITIPLGANLNRTGLETSGSSLRTSCLGLLLACKAALKRVEDYEIFPKKVLGEGCSGLVVMAQGRKDGRRLGRKLLSSVSVFL